MLDSRAGQLQLIPIGIVPARQVDPAIRQQLHRMGAVRGRLPVPLSKHILVDGRKSGGQMAAA